MAERVEDIGEPLLDHYLRTLVAVRLPACEILGQADAQGVDSQALCRIARALLPSLPAAADPDLAALCLALGSARNWRTLKAKVYRFREAFLAPLSLPYYLAFETLLTTLGETLEEPFRRTVLARLGYPMPPLKGMGKADPAGWQDAGWGLVPDHLEIQDGPSLARPAPVRILGDLRIRDGAELEELPTLAVAGSLLLEGRSGLRRLAPGTVIGRHLDLRGCTLLEAIPRGIRVGGWMHLPPHLHRNSPVSGVMGDDPGPPRDRYPGLRTLLLGFKFEGLCAPAERAAVGAAALAALACLRDEVRRDPRTEFGLLLAAAEVWRDLAEERWAGRNTAGLDWNPEDEDLPMVWLRDLLGTG